MARVPNPGGWETKWRQNVRWSSLPSSHLTALLMLLGEWELYARALEEAGQWEH